MSTEFRKLSPAEELILRAEYPITDAQSLAEKMGITSKQVSSFARRRGLKKTDAFKAESAAEKAMVLRQKAEDRRAERIKEKENESVSLRMFGEPEGIKRITAGGAAYLNGHITTHMMRG